MSAPRAEQPVHLGIETEGLKALARDMRRVKDIRARHMQKALKAGAQIIADDVKGRWSWSRRLPRSVRATAGAKSAAVVAGGKKAPDAVFWEGEGTTHHRHPVFARRTTPRAEWTWTGDPAARPAMVPSLVANVDRVAEKVADGLVDVFREVGFK